MVESSPAINAIVPDQLTHYVQAVGMPLATDGACPLYLQDGFGVLVAYPPDPYDQAAVDEAVARAVKTRGLKNITVLSALRPSAAPAASVSSRDFYWRLALPARPPQKTRNMINRALRDIEISCQRGGEAWSDAHSALVNDFCARKPDLERGSIHIFSSLKKYLASSGDVLLFSASKPDGTLCACAIADFSSLAQAFYMFAFRSAEAPPGSADALLGKIAIEADKRGYESINLGLGIGPGVEFFKRKWGAIPGLPYFETSWRKPGFFASLFAK